MLSESDFTILRAAKTIATQERNRLMAEGTASDDFYTAGVFAGVADALLMALSVYEVRVSREATPAEPQSLRVPEDAS